MQLNNWQTDNMQAEDWAPVCKARDVGGQPVSAAFFCFARKLAELDI